jgi:adenine-specific DNA-methyltransferase
VDVKIKKPDQKEIEQYDHKGKDRVNIPPVGLVTPETDREIGHKSYAYDPHLDPALEFDSQRSAVEKIIDMGLSAEHLEDAQEALSELKRRQEPYLNWAGKAEHTSFDITTVSLHVHERIDPLTIIESVRKKDERPTVQVQLSFFEAPDENPPLREAIEFYKHKHNWSNRLIAGDNLLVMNSLIEKEGLAGQVQMIYIDPPYGIRYGSNFQPFINKRDVKDGKDVDLTQEPEMIKAYRDTWELGIHSYLTYLRDRLLLARELLNETGSIFVQISDENIQLVKCLLDEIFGDENFISIIPFVKTSGFAPRFLPNICDILLWYGKNKQYTKYHQLYKDKIEGRGFDVFQSIQLKDGTRRKLTPKERQDRSLIPADARLFRSSDLISQGATSSVDEFEFMGGVYRPRQGSHWKTSIAGLHRLADAGRIMISAGYPRYIRFLDDFPVTALSNLWDDTATGSFTEDKIFVVQTGTKTVARCILMTTDPGDLVLDPTCGSGTTAYVAESWGRRWITCDTSRVAVVLAKQRLMTASYDYYELAFPEEGVGSGFKYLTVPHITLKSVARNEPTDSETLYDKPVINKTKTRISGPFTVEAVPSPIVKPITEMQQENADDVSITRSGETLRQDEWRDELLRTGIRGKSGQYIHFSRVESLPGTRWLHADAETKENDPKRAVISFGPEHAPLEQRQVALALEEAQTLIPKPKIVVFASFHFDPESAKDIDETNWPGVMLLKVQMNADLLTEDLKKKRASNESFWLIGQPDVRLTMITEGSQTGTYQAEVLGFDYYNIKTGNIESGGAEKIALWMLDTDYDGRSLFPRQVFFPLAGEKEGWYKLARTLKAEIQENLIEAYRGTVSLPFKIGDNKRIAVKIIDDRGIESLRIIEVE